MRFKAIQLIFHLVLILVAEAYYVAVDTACGSRLIGALEGGSMWYTTNSSEVEYLDMSGVEQVEFRGDGNVDIIKLSKGDDIFARVDYSDDVFVLSEALKRVKLPAASAMLRLYVAHDASRACDVKDRVPAFSGHTTSACTPGDVNNYGDLGWFTFTTTEKVMMAAIPLSCVCCCFVGYGLILVLCQVFLSAAVYWKPKKVDEATHSLAHEGCSELEDF